MQSTNNLSGTFGPLPELIADDQKAPDQHLSNLCIHLFGRRITLMTTLEILKSIDLACAQNRRITVANYNTHAFNLSMQLPWFYSFLQQSELVHCDGAGILRGLRWLGLTIPREYRVSYTELMPRLLATCNQESRRVFLLGAKPEYLDGAIAQLQQQYPNSTFAGQHGYFDRNDLALNDEIVATINEFKPHILIVGMGMPIQESWVQRYRDRLHVNAILVGGAVIDRMAGMVQDCPQWIADRELEWAYRLVKEPKRLASRYLLGNPAFLLQVGLAKFANSASNHLFWATKINQADLLMNAAYLDGQQSLETERPQLIGRYLIEAGLVTQAQVDAALIEQGESGIRLGSILAGKGWVQQQTVDFLVQQIQQRISQQHSRAYRKFGEYLVEAGLVTEDDVQAALAEQQLTGMRLGSILAGRGLIGQQTVDFLVEQVTSISNNRPQS
ncbi:WecB/TagA/CpsF family glycosyltransferase [filamentous cyanobacterium LEGE 11480]|uniref:WecB/TagA/CpsF family glycosyltransferase n=1 Tax=Romeriopsis navalis LEGE 11480 TaxID=2777977 RepID=A0A928VIN4_9CYAN|nr:WecB/TagA/CpsF family glycosyltransferase [Romeriopsis navalis]MBE9028463.1 WecB/TagA/CpsF family glycosyltransferase [Romeriopsis navalis LEGE 11480]